MGVYSIISGCFKKFVSFFTVKTIFTTLAVLGAVVGGFFLDYQITKLYNRLADTRHVKADRIDTKQLYIGNENSPFLVGLYSDENSAVIYIENNPEYKGKHKLNKSYIEISKSLLKDGSGDEAEIFITDEKGRVYKVLEVFKRNRLRIGRGDEPESGDK